MYKELIFKKICNHWYVSIPHDDPSDLILDEKIEKCLSILDNKKEEIVKLLIISQNSILLDNTLQFRDGDLNRYFTTDDDFNFIVYIGDRTFPISSTLYSLLEENYNFNFHKELYSVQIN